MSGADGDDEVAARYDEVAPLYAELFRDELDAHPSDRDLVERFARLVVEGGGGPVADLGCGPGHVTVHLAALGLSVVGVDRSRGMVDEARRWYPDLTVCEGDLRRLPFRGGALAGALVRYSVIHVRPDELGGVLVELGRVLAPGGHLLLSFHGAGEVHGEPFDHKVCPAYRYDPGVVAGLLAEMGLEERTSVVRPPEAGERFDQASLVMRKAPRHP